MPLPGAGGEMALRRATSELFQTGHFHDQVQVVAVFEGWRSFATSCGSIRAEAGDVLVIPSGMFHAPRMSDRSSVLILFVDNDHPVVRGVHRPFVTDGNGARRVEDIFDRVAEWSAREAVPEQLRISSTLTKLVAQHDVSISELAEQFGYSPDGFIRSFCRSVGTTPGKYRIAHRLTVARSMIRQCGSLADIAFATGFADQSHLGRCFLRAFGTTPAAYRAGLATA